VARCRKCDINLALQRDTPFDDPRTRGICDPLLNEKVSSEPLKGQRSTDRKMQHENKLGHELPHN
jgi:hypothetical protein